MQSLQKIKLTIKDGKETDRQSIDGARPVADSVADELLQKAKESAKEFKETKGIKTVIIWEEVKEKKASKTDK